MSDRLFTFHFPLSTIHYLLCLLLVACGGETAVTPSPVPTPIVAFVATATLSPTEIALTPVPSPTLLPSVTPDPSPTPPLDTGWQTLYPGFEQREITLEVNGRRTEHLTIIRVDPGLYQIGIAYHPGQPQSLRDWQKETSALLVINGGFYTEEFYATGRIVVDGEASGLSYEGFGGMLAIDPAGNVSVRSLEAQPYNPDESLSDALQAFPMLVKPGGVQGFTDQDQTTARRTVVAQDGNGRLLFLVAPWGSFTLHDLSAYLAQSDLGLETALNLDGGPSTGLLVANPLIEVPAFTVLPAVITVHPKSSE